MNRHCMTMTARAELNLWSKYWSRAVVGGGVLYILYCGVYILNCGWPHSSSQYIIGAAYTNPPILTDRVNAYRAPDWALFAKIFTSTLPWMNSVLVVVVSLYLPFSSSLQSWVWDHIYLLGLRLGPYLRCTRAPPLSSASHHCSLLQSTLLHQTLLSFHQAGTSTTIYYILWNVLHNLLKLLQSISWTPLFLLILMSWKSA